MRCPNCQHVFGEQRNTLHRPLDILERLCPPEVYAESDGYRRIDVFINVDPPEGFEKMKRDVVLKIAKMMPCETWYQLPGEFKHLNKVIWVDDEFVSLQSPESLGYSVYKLAELNSAGV